MTQDANRIIAQTLHSAADKAFSIDSLFVDFDSTRFHMSTPNSKSEVLLSMDLRCWNDLLPFGVQERLDKEYAGLVHSQTEPGWSITLRIDLTALPPKGPGTLARLLRDSICCRLTTRGRKRGTR